MPPATSPRKAVREGSRVRARTRALLVDAALRVFARKGIGAAPIHEITKEAGVANGTFYNYFRAREELVAAASGRLAEHLVGEIAVSYERVADPAERVAIGSRRFMLQAIHDPVWGAAVLRVWSSTALLRSGAAAFVLADLRAGQRRGRFVFGSEAAALDLLQGSVLSAMRTMLEGRAGEEHASAVAALVLRGLGVDRREAEKIAARPLPPLASAAPPVHGAARRTARHAGSVVRRREAERGAVWC